MGQKLESAKFVWLEALRLSADVQTGRAGLLRSRELLQRAAGIKEGWGWGVNNGDIHLTLAAVDLALWARSRADTASSAADESDWRAELLTEADAGVALCQARDGSQAPVAEWLREVAMFLDSVKAAGGKNEAEDAAVEALDDDMEESVRGGANVWRERTADACRTVAAHIAPRKPTVLPTPQAKRPMDDASPTPEECSE